MSIIVIFKSITNIVFILTIQKSYTILQSIFVTEVSTVFIAILISIIMLKRLYKSKNDDCQTITQKNLAREFVFHSGIMWVNNNIKSLSERNFMMLFFTHLLGPLQANLFKLANDGALLFQRIVVKTIGTTDTSLLSYVQVYENSKNTKVMQIAFQNIATKISYLCIPLLGVLFFITCNFSYLFSNRFAFKIFFVIATFYLFEHLLSPYERLLEIKRRYLMLSFSYLPYIFILILLVYFKFATSAGLFKTILAIHAARISSCLALLFLAKRTYGVRFPVKNIIKVAFFTVLTVLSLSLLTFIIKTLVYYKPIVL
ncbi:hypothetical protein ACFLYU_05710 [Candidatus Dependentiae bacterium]